MPGTNHNPTATRTKTPRYDDLRLLYGPPGGSTGFAAAVAAERRRQDAKWGRSRHRWCEWMSVLTEEVGEACAAANQATWRDNPAPVLGELRRELIQVAAVCAAVVEHLDEESGVAR